MEVKDWTARKEDALVQIALASLDENVKAIDYVRQAAFTMSQAIKPDNMQFVVKMMRGKDAYRIIVAVPSDGLRHGINEMGDIREKVALQKAFAQKDVIIVNRAWENPDTAYMHEHAKNKCIGALAVIPLGKFLVVIDKARPIFPGNPEKLACVNETDFIEEDKNFTQDETHFLKDCFKLMQKTLAEQVRKSKARRKDIQEQNRTIFTGLDDLFKNSLNSIVLAVKQLRKAIDENNPHMVEVWLNLIETEGKRSIGNLELTGAYAKHCTPDDGPVAGENLSNLLAIFHKDENYQVLGDVDSQMQIMVSDRKLALQVFEGIKRFMDGNGKQDELLVRVFPSDQAVEVLFECPGFHPSKVGNHGTTDLILLLIRDAVEALGIAPDIQIGSFRMVFPT